MSSRSFNEVGSLNSEGGLASANSALIPRSLLRGGSLEFSARRKHILRFPGEGGHCSELFPLLGWPFLCLSLCAYPLKNINDGQDNKSHSLIKIVWPKEQDGSKHSYCPFCYIYISQKKPFPTHRETKKPNQGRSCCNNDLHNWTFKEQGV